MRAVELFCGAGGMSRGLIDAKIQVVAAYDFNPDTVEVYRQNIGPHAAVMDLSNVLHAIRVIAPLRPDLLCGGPPCQDFSLAGRRIEGDRADLTIAYATIVASVRPEWFFMENVIPALNSQAWSDAKAILKRAGYGVSVSKIDCSRYGVGQSRRRAIVIGRLGERDRFLESDIAKLASAERMNIYEALHTISYFNSEFDFRRRPDDLATLGKRYVFTRPWTGHKSVQSIREPLPTITRRSDEVPGPRHFNNPHPDDPVPVQKANVLTIRQRSRLNGFPANWNWGGLSKASRMLMIANAVPAPVAKRIGTAILQRHLGKTHPEIEGNFRQWLLARHKISRETASNRVSLLKKGRALLGGRTFDIPALEIATLDATPRFVALEKNERSGIRRAVSQYAQYVDEKTGRGTQTAPWTGLGIMDIEVPTKAIKRTKIDRDELFKNMSDLADYGDGATEVVF